MSHCVLWVLAGALALPPVTAAPLPNFDESVDYVAWLRSQLAFASEGNAVDALGGVLYSHGTDPADDFLEAAGPGVKHQLAAVLKEHVPWSPTQYVELNKWVEEVESRWRPVFVALAKKPHYAMRVDRNWHSLRDVRLGRLQNAPNLGRGLVAGAWRITGKITYADRFEFALRANFALSDHYSEGLTQEEQLIAAGHRRFLYEQIRYACPNPLIRKAYWRRINTFLETADTAPLTVCYARGLHFEEARAFEDLLRVFRKDEAGDGYSFDPAAWTELARVEPRLGRLPESVRADVSAADPHDLAAVIRAQYDAYRALLESADGRGLRDKLTRIDEDTIGATPGLRAFTSSQKLGIISAFRAEALRRSVHLYLKAFVHHQASGRWPGSFDELGGADLAACRIDPFTGKDLLTRVVKGALLVYSVGPDGKDDRASAFSDVVFITRPPN